MTVKSTGWTVEKRARAAERMKAQKPWLKTTGPKTPEGKAAVSQNALKHGFYSAEFKALYAVLSAQAKFVREVTKV